MLSDSYECSDKPKEVMVDLHYGVGIPTSRPFSPFCRTRTPSHPVMPEILPAPGPFGADLGALNVISFIVLHLIFGLVIGVIYTPVHLPAAPTGSEQPQGQDTASAGGKRR